MFSELIILLGAVLSALHNLPHLNLTIVFLQKRKPERRSCDFLEIIELLSSRAGIQDQMVNKSLLNIYYCNKWYILFYNPSVSEFYKFRCQPYLAPVPTFR